jgi:hypothetical protein
MFPGIVREVGASITAVSEGSPAYLQPIFGLLGKCLEVAY